MKSSRKWGHLIDQLFRELARSEPLPAEAPRDLPMPPSVVVLPVFIARLNLGWDDSMLGPVDKLVCLTFRNILGDDTFVVHTSAPSRPVHCVNDT